MAAGGGGAWKVAYADFVTAMMAFFMVMWLVGQKDEAKHAIAHYFQEPLDDQQAHAEAIALSSGAHKPHEHKGEGKVKSVSSDPHQPEAKKSRILALHGADRAALGTLIQFPADSVELDATAKELLDLALPKFSGIPHKIEIRGHVSNRSATQNDAWKLSYDRSLTVMAYLVKHGIAENRIRLAQAGQHEPVSISGTLEAMERNSRVDVFVLEEFVEDTLGTPEERLRRQEADSSSPKPKDANHEEKVETPKRIYRGGEEEHKPAAAAGHGKKGGDDHHGGHGAPAAPGGHGAKGSGKGQSHPAPASHGAKAKGGH